jgi:hypothetical protein
MTNTEPSDDDAAEQEFWENPPPPDDGQIHDAIGYTEVSYVEDGERIREVVNGVRTHKPNQENHDD